MRNRIPGIGSIPIGFMIALLLPACTTNTEQMKIPALVSPGDPGYLTGELIFEPDRKPTPQCHASTIVETPAGMVAAWFGGSHEKNPDVGIWVSRKVGEHRSNSVKGDEHRPEPVKGDEHRPEPVDVGEHWSEPVEVARGMHHDTLYPCWNPVLFQVDGGPLLLFYKVGPDPRHWWGEMMTSGDGGLTWSASRKLGKGRLGDLIGPVKNKPVLLENGTLFCPSSTEKDENGELRWKVHFELTRDLGSSWEVIGPINDGEQFDAIQPSILTFENGIMQVLCRTRQGVIAQSRSEDGGRTWSLMTATPLPNPSAGTDAVTLEDGRQLLVYNHTRREGPFPSGRNMLNVAVSEDGMTWDPVMTLERSRGEYSYPAVIQASDGKVHITYTFRRESVKHVVLDPEKL